MQLWNFLRSPTQTTPTIEPLASDALPRENWRHERSAHEKSLAFQASAAAFGGITVLTGCAATATEAEAAPRARVLMDGDERVTVRLAPRSATAEQNYQHYKRIIEASGGQMKANGATVLGLRGLDLGGTVRETRARVELVDTFVVLQRTASGKAVVQEFRGSSYPGQRASRASPDVTGDRVGDVGMIAEGHFSVVANGPFKGKPSYHVRTLSGGGRLEGIRDTNHDGVHSAGEWSASRARGDRLGEVLFHRTGKSGGVSSIGCLNIADLDGFVKAVGGKGASFRFSLVNAKAAEAR